MEFPNLWGQRVIIAMKGLPCTGKSEFAREIGFWGRCPVFYIDDFLCTLSKEKGYKTTKLPPSQEEVDRLHRVAFDGLCKAAARQLDFRSSCVVIKSRLISTFELDRLAELSRGCRYNMDYRIIIIECQVKNEHRFRLQLDAKVDKYKDEEAWYRPRSWKDIEKVREECGVDAQDNWDLHLLHLLNEGSYNFRPGSIVIRLVLDAFDDLHLRRHVYLGLTSSVQHVLKNLMQMTPEDRQEDPNLRSDPRSSRYMVVQFNDERRYLVEKELQRARERSNYLCASYGIVMQGQCCVFKYLPEGISSNSKSDNHIYNCGVCEERVDGVSGQPAYSCHFCFLTLHKFCAELKDVELLLLLKCSYVYNLYRYPFNTLKPQVHACKSCMEGGKDFSNSCRSCLYQTHLKARKFPTIIYHDSHPEHFLSLEILTNFGKCNACGDCYDYSSYGCYICELYYGIMCICLPRELEHMHGGHKHVLKLMYSHDHDEEEEESYWCEVCYKDMDPQYWFYSCQACPFVAHPKCINPFSMYELEWWPKGESTSLDD